MPPHGRGVSRLWRFRLYQGLPGPRWKCWSPACCPASGGRALPRAGWHWFSSVV